jgi:hypothetical protein
MRTHGEHLRTLQRRVDFLKSREHKNSFDLAELGALEWAVVNLQPQRQWAGLTDEEIEQGCKESWVTEQAWQSAVWWAEAKLKEKNT